MKKLSFLSAFIVLFAAIGFTSCDSEPVDPLLIGNQPTEPTGPAIFKVDFSGETFTADQVQAVMADGMIVIGGVQGNEQVSIAIPATTTGTYSGDQVLMAYHPTLTPEYQYWNVDDELNSTGSVTITSINTTNHTISGTFNFVGHWSNSEENHPSIAFTNGSFQNIPYTGNIVNPTDDEYVKAKVNGVQKNYSIIASLEAGNNVSFSGNIVSPASSVQVLVPTNVTPGTYAFVDAPMAVPSATYSDDSNEWGYDAVSGSVTIISNSGGWLKGTFQFTGDDGEGNTVQITEGEFNIELP